eukprot:923791-Pleurochrysis_carterae.AAC.2
MAALPCCFKAALHRTHPALRNEFCASCFVSRYFIFCWRLVISTFTYLRLNRNAGVSSSMLLVSAMHESPFVLSDLAMYVPHLVRPTRTAK